MSFSDTFAPNGGRNLAPSHGAITGMFRRYFVPGASCSVTALSINGTAVVLADFGLDVAPASGVPFFVGKTGDSITAITVTGGPAFVPYASDQARP